MTKRRLPSLNGLHAFEAAARLGRMTAAAEELSVTPGAVSRQIGQLELRLGVRLFEGPKNRPRLTGAGQALLPALSDAFDQIDAAVHAVRDNEGGTLDVSCFSTFTVKWLIPRLYQFKALHPEIDIRLSADGADRARERCDVAITLDDAASLEAPATLALFPERLGPVLAPALAAGIALRAPQDLAGQPLLHAKTRVDAWQAWCAAQGCTFSTQAGAQFDHYYFTLEAAIGGLGICIAPWHLVIDDIRAGRLVAPLGFQESGFHYVAKRRAQAGKKLDTFCAWLQAQARATPQP